jgi:hypothetical protein
MVALFAWDLFYLLRCVLDASVLAYYDSDLMLVTNHRLIFKRFLK